MPLNLPPSMKRTLLHAGGGAAAGAALGGLTADPEHRLRGAVQGGAVGGLAAGGATALANRSAGQRINALKGDVATGAQQYAAAQAAHATERMAHGVTRGQMNMLRQQHAAEQAAHAATQGEFQGLQQQYGQLNANHEQAQMALRGASAANSELGGRLYTAETRLARLTGQPSNPVSHVPMTPVPAQANAVVDRALQTAVSPTPPVSHVTPVPPARAAMTPPPPAAQTTPNAVPFQPWASGPMAQVKAAMSPLGGALAGAVTGGVIGGGSSALSGERDPKKLARNAAGGAVLGGCAGFGIAHNAGKCEHARGLAEGYERRKQFEPQLEELMQQAGTRLMGPLDALRGAL